VRNVVLKKGDVVVIDGRVPATVVLASENGRSLGLAFEAIIDIKGTGLLAVGHMLLSMVEDGRYVELMTGAVIDLSRPA
jgi:hypothetical protein